MSQLFKAVVHYAQFLIEFLGQSFDDGACHATCDNCQARAGQPPPKFISALPCIAVDNGGTKSASGRNTAGAAPKKDGTKSRPGPSGFRKKGKGRGEGAAWAKGLEFDTQ